MVNRKVVVLLVALCAGAVFAQTSSEASVAELVRAGLQGNLDLRKARQTLADAEEALPWQSELPNTQAKLTGGYTSSGELTGQAQLTVPIIPQLSMGASVSSTGSAGATLSVSPFAAWRSSFKQEASYRTAKAQLEYQTAKLGFDIESAAWSLLQASVGLDIAKAKLALEQVRAGIATKTYELGELTYDDFQSAQSSLISARQSGFDAERAVLSSRVELYRLLGSSEGEPGVKEVSLDELIALIATRDGEIASKDAARAATLALRQAETNLDSLKAELKATPVYRPSVSLSGQISYGPEAKTEPDAPAQWVFSGSGSLSVSFSPSDIKADEHAAIVESIELAERQAELERTALKLESSIQLQALEVTRQVLEARQGELRQAEATLESTRLLLEQGERTAVDAEGARIGVESAELRLLQGATGVLDAQAKILLYYTI